jgi:hypothetical protein
MSPRRKREHAKDCLKFPATPEACGEGDLMKIIHRRCAALDVHEKRISVCARIVRGSKTDRVDAARIAELLQYGLVRPSFVPPRAVRELRDLVRQRVQVIGDRNRISNAFTACWRRPISSSLVFSERSPAPRSD